MILMLMLKWQGFLFSLPWHNFKISQSHYIALFFLSMVARAELFAQMKLACFGGGNHIYEHVILLFFWKFV